MSIVISDEEAKANIAANCKRLRGDRSYSELARACTTQEWTCYAATIQQIESGRHLPGSGLLARLAEALGTTTDILLSPPPKKKSRQPS